MLYVVNTRLHLSLAFGRSTLGSAIEWLFTRRGCPIQVGGMDPVPTLSV